MAEAHARTFCTEKEDSKMQKMMIHYNDVPIYPIVLSENFDALGEALDDLMIKDRKVCIVTDSHVADFYLEQVEHIVKEHCAAASHFIFPAGEESKTLTTVENLYEYKNMVGAFHQPKLVYSCAETLKTLTSQQYISGLGEIIKHGLIKDAAYYEWLKAHKEAILARDTQTVIDMIAVSCHIKKEVVENDPEEAGERALLNFGHTLGHAVEKLMNFTMLHGECVAVGMHAAAWLSMEKGMLTEAAYKDITDTIVSFGLPVSVKGLEPEQIVAVSKSDKKMDKGRVKFILLDPEGHAVIDRSIRDEQLLAAASVIVRNGEQS